MEEKRRPKWIVPVGIGCVVILCLCLLGAGGFYFLGDRIVGDLGGLGNIPGLSEEFEDFLDTGEIPEPPSDLPVEPDTPDQPEQEPPQDDSSPSGGQISEQTSFFDDFSSDALDWAVIDDGITLLQYENQAYSFMIKEPNYVDGVRIPTFFNPTYIKFDVWGPPGEQGGTIGVECMVQLDGELLTDYYYVEFDLDYQEIIVGGVINEEYVDFYDPGDTYGRLPLQHMTSNPDQTNTIEVTCLPQNVTVSVNGYLEQDIPVPQDFILANPGPMTFFMYTFEETMAGYKVFFDNVSAMP